MILHIFSAFISNNIDTFSVTAKQYLKIIIFERFLSHETDIFGELPPNTTYFFHGRCTDNTPFSQMWTYFKSLLIGISVTKSTFSKVFDFKMLKKTVEIFTFAMITSICLSQISPTNQKWTLPGLLMSCSRLLHLIVYHNLAV